MSGVDRRLKKKVGANIRAQRDAQGLTQVDVARAIGLAAESYGRIERGNSFPSIPTLIKLSKVLDVSMEDLLGSPPRQPAPSRPRPDIQRLLHLVKDLDVKTLRQINKTVEMIAKANAK